MTSPLSVTRCQRDRTAGFSIIEVLVAFAILSMVVTLCLQVYANSARSETMARWSEEAHVVLRDRLAALTTLGLQPGQQAEGRRSGWSALDCPRRQPTGDGDVGNGRGVVWFTAQVTDPTGRVYTASTSRWLGEAFPEARAMTRATE